MLKVDFSPAEYLCSFYEGAQLWRSCGGSAEDRGRRSQERSDDGDTRVARARQLDGIEERRAIGRQPEWWDERLVTVFLIVVKSWTRDSKIARSAAVVAK